MIRRQSGKAAGEEGAGDLAGGEQDGQNGEGVPGRGEAGGDDLLNQALVGVRMDWASAATLKTDICCGTRAPVLRWVVWASWIMRTSSIDLVVAIDQLAHGGVEGVEGGKGSVDGDGVRWTARATDCGASKTFLARLTTSASSVWVEAGEVEGFQLAA